MTIAQFGYIAVAAIGVAAAYYWPKVYAAIKAKI